MAKAANGSNALSSALISAKHGAIAKSKISAGITRHSSSVSAISRRIMAARSASGGGGGENGGNGVIESEIMTSTAYRVRAARAHRVIWRSVMAKAAKYLGVEMKQRGERAK